MQLLLRLLSAAFLLSLTLFVGALTWAVWHNASFSGDTQAGKDYVAAIEVKGIITKSGKTLAQIKDVLEDSKAKALIVRVNSPGGLVGPSQEIFEALKAADKKIPVVVSMGSLAASGGYYIALGGRKIFANPGTLTASIGVIMEFANLEKLYQWAKVDRFALKAGKMKDVGSESRKMTPEEREFLTELLADIHKQFQGAVKERRNLTDEELAKWTDGRVMSGAQAKAANLVDELGGIEVALASARQLANLPDDAPMIFDADQHRNFLKELILGSDDSEDGFLSSAKGALDSFSALTSPPRWRVLLLAPVE